MDWLIADIERNGPATTEEDARQRPIPDFEGQAAGTPLNTALAAVLGLLDLHPDRADTGP